MFRHVVLIRFAEHATPSDKDALVAALRELPGQISEIRAYVLGLDAGIGEGNYDLAIVADFDDRDAYRIYTTHPAHVRVVTERLRPITAARVAIQHQF